MILGKYNRVGNRVRVACVLYIWAARRSGQWFASELIELDVSSDKYIERHQCIWPNPRASSVAFVDRWSVRIQCIVVERTAEVQPSDTDPLPTVPSHVCGYHMVTIVDPGAAWRHGL
jgi:hypothetical protein